MLDTLPPISNDVQKRILQEIHHSSLAIVPPVDLQ
jgi:hypothetical protein